MQIFTGHEDEIALEEERKNTPLAKNQLEWSLIEDIKLILNDGNNFSQDMGWSYTPLTNNEKIEKIKQLINYYKL